MRLLLHLVQVVHLFTPHLVTHLVTHHLVTQPVAAGSSPRLAPLTGPARAAAPSPPAMEPVYWHSANPRFQGGQGLVLYPQIGDKLDIICPHEFRPAGAQGAAPYEYHRLYVVSREQADRCDTVQRPRVLLTCERPDADLRYTLKFQEVSPNFLGLEFRRHRDYYITSTSNGTLEGLENQRGGVCRSHAMRILLRVGQDPRAPAHVTSVTRRPTPGSGSSREPVVIVVPPPPHGGGGGAPPPTNRPGVSDPRSGVGEGPGPGPGGETLLGSDVALIVGVASGCLIFLLLALFLLLFLLRQRRRSNHHHHNHHHGNNNHNNSNHQQQQQQQHGHHNHHNYNHNNHHNHYNHHHQQQQQQQQQLAPLYRGLVSGRKSGHHHHHHHHHGGGGGGGGGGAMHHLLHHQAPLRHPGPYSLTTLANARRAVSLSAGGGGGGGGHPPAPLPLPSPGPLAPPPLPPSSSGTATSSTSSSSSSSSSRGPCATTGGGAAARCGSGGGGSGSGGGGSGVSSSTSLLGAERLAGVVGGEGAARRSLSLASAAGASGTEASDVLVALRPASAVLAAAAGGGAGGLVAGGPGAPHYEKVSGDYGHPIYIVQGPDRSPSNVYYKV
ncbi:uncharacterized protein LOC142908104 [Petromyzon marinus]|uniref:uncharacterized protein LOC142908104 n=1 Tax=Petromyzon marinus TaxID=7757 RepID=UPI003F6FBB24